MYGDGRLVWDEVSESARLTWRQESARLLGEKIEGVVPDAPFKKSWPLLTMKRMVKYAADQGFDAVSWDTGETQAERYDLSNQVNSISSTHKMEDGIYSISAETHDGEVINKNLREDELSDFVGKDMAEKIVGASRLERSNKFEGIDLKVGGEGLKSFYDRLLPNVVNKFFKGAKWGNARVEKGGFVDRKYAPVLTGKDKGR